MSNKPKKADKKPQSKYRITIYLGKKNYEFFSKLAHGLGIKTGQLVKVVLDAGLDITKLQNKEWF